MNFDIFLSIAALILIVLGWYLGYLSTPNREARELLRNKQEAEANEKRREAQRVAKEAAQEAFRKDLWDELQFILDRPDRFKGNQYGSGSRGGFTHGIMPRFIEVFGRPNHEHHVERQRRLEEQVSEQAKTIRSMRKNMMDIHTALQMGQPIE